MVATKNTFTGASSVDFLEDTTVRGRLIWDVNDALSLDMRAGVSEVSGGAINFNAVFALPAFANDFGLGPTFFADVNEHEFIFANNVPGENKQDTEEFSIKADWDRYGVDVSAVFSYSNLEEYLLSDGTSATFYGYELTSACQADRATLNNTPASLGGAGRTDLFGDFFAPFGVFPAGVEFQGIYGPYTPTACDGYQYQERNQSDTSLEIRLTSDDDAKVSWIAGVYAAEIERQVVVGYGAVLSAVGPAAREGGHALHHHVADAAHEVSCLEQALKMFALERAHVPELLRPWVGQLERGGNHIV